MKSPLQQLSTRLDAILTEFKKLDLGEKMEGMACSLPNSRGKYYPSLYLPTSAEEDGLPDEGEAVVKYKVTRRSKETREGKTTHNATVEVHSIEPVETKAKSKAKTGEAKLLAARLDGILNEFATYGERPRSKQGTFVADETGGADPASMRQAYAPRSPLKPAMIGAVAGAGAMSKRGRKLVGRVGRGVMKGVKASLR